MTSSLGLSMIIINSSNDSIHMCVASEKISVGVPQLFQSCHSSSLNLWFENYADNFRNGVKVNDSAFVKGIGRKQRKTISWLCSLDALQVGKSQHLLVHPRTSLRKVEEQEIGRVAVVAQVPI